jgi:hypothetical protein
MTAKSIIRLSQLSHAHNLAAITTLTVLFISFSAVGSKLIYRSLERAPGYNARIAEGRAIAFPFVMLFVHVVGYRLWKLQFSPERYARLALYWPPMKTALLQQATCSILAALTLDMGETWHSNMISLLAYWMSVGLIVARRLDAPTRGDLFFIRWAFLAIWFFAMIVGPTVWYRMEY